METQDNRLKVVAKPAGYLVAHKSTAPATPLPAPKDIKWLFDKAWVWEVICRCRTVVLASTIGLALVGVVLGYFLVPQTAVIGMRAVNTEKNSPETLQMIAGVSVEVTPGKEPNTFVLKVSSPSAIEALQKADTLTRDILDYNQHRFAQKLQTLDEDLAAANRRLAETVRDANFADLEKGTSGYLLQHEELGKKLETLRVDLDTLDMQITNSMQLIVQHHPALLSARKSLEEGLLRYTEEHPVIQEYRRNIYLIEARISQQSASGDPEIALTGSSLAQSLYAKVLDLRSQRMILGKQWEETKALNARLESKIAEFSDRQLAYAKAKSEYDALRSSRETLQRQREESQLAQGGWQVAQPARLEGELKRQQVIAFWGIRGGLLGLVAAGLLVVLVEVSDRRIRSPRELERVTGLPIMGSLGDLRQMTEADRRAWAFQTLTALQGKVAGSSQQPLVCGIVSSEPGEGRSTWVQLLADAARERGYKVIALDFNNAKDGSPKVETAEEPGHVEIEPQDLTRTAALAKRAADGDRLSPPINWAWNLERRTQWQEVLEQLKTMQNVVVLFELPPASAAEATLLSENVSPLLWLCGRDRAKSDTTLAQLETLRNARGRVVGTLFNYGPRRWAKAAAALLFAAFLTPALFGQPAFVVPPTNTPPFLAVTEMPATAYATVSPTNVADWQKHLTLGPGDVLSISIYRQADSARPSVVIGPDGRFNYLQARDFMAAGLTVDELREQLEKTLLKYYQPPLRVIVLPQVIKSKKYYVLGNVVNGGVYSLERPMTVIEAIASAGGFVSLMDRRQSVMLADLTRSFLVRKEASGEFRRMDVNFEKLFAQGDLAQNIALAPDDYLYFPPMDLPEVYVLGEVLHPGTATFGTGMSAMKAIVNAGGFTPQAWRQKILIIRGSLTAPKTFVLDGADVLNAKSLDFKLEARDLVFVYRKPWSKAEELLELAITDFLDAAIITYTGQHVGPFISTPVIK
jgi:polysaccharide biosynthesis/export protein